MILFYIGLVVTLETVYGLIIPEIPSGASKFLSVFAKIKLVDSRGKSGYKAIGHEFRTSPFSLSTTGLQDSVTLEASFVFHAEQLATKHCFVRVEFCAEDITSFFSLGAAFVPFDYCGSKKSHRYVFPIVPFHSTNKGYPLHRENPRVSIVLRRIEEQSEIRSPPSMCFSSSFSFLSLFTTSWAGEAIVGQRESDAPDTELVSVALQHEFLRLSNLSLSLHSKVNSGKLNDKTTEQVSADSKSSTEKSEFFFVEIYENERRTLYPPFDWCKTTLTRPRLSNFDYTLKFSLKDKDESKLPSNCEWTGEWITETNFSPGTDIDGWVYGISFGRLLAQQRQRLPSASSVQSHARRRKWRRKVRVDTSVFSTQFALQNLFERINTVQDDATNKSVYLENEQLYENDNSWRISLSKKAPSAVLHGCRERATESSDVIIDWSHVGNVAIISPSLVTLTVQVDRYFAQPCSYRPVEVSLFICNCPASAIKDLIEERIALCKTRDDIHRVKVERDIVDQRDIETILDNTNPHEEGGVPDTTQLSLGSELLCELDDLGLILQQRMQMLLSIVEPQNKVGDFKAESELTIIARRLCRLRLYVATLIALELPIQHQFEINLLRSQLEKDIELSHHILLDNEVATARNRVEYLLDVAEKRIRDAALCAWKYRRHGFEKGVEILANDFLAEVAGLLGAFFENKQIQANVKVSFWWLFMRAVLVFKILLYIMSGVVEQS
jgi:hypothetical protein